MESVKTGCKTGCKKSWELIKKCGNGIAPCLRKTAICLKKTTRCCKRLCTKINIFCGRLCTGKTSCWINLICWFPVLIYLSLKIYLIPCIGIIMGRIFTFICCCLCRFYCAEDYIFTDNQFPANVKSLQLEDKEVQRSVLWIRAHELALKEPDIELKVKSNDNCIRPDDEHEENDNNIVPKTPQMYLFRNGINPSDAVQGKLADCWLIAAIACLSEFPGAIESLFCTKETNERHKYWIKLYDARLKKEKFQKIYIDDYIPCDQDTERPLFAKPSGNELWVLLLEKAFAKFVGNYGRLEGGHTMWAMQAMTGCYCMRFEYDQSKNDQNEEQQDEDEENGGDTDIEEEDYEEFEENDENEDTDDEILEIRNVSCWRKWDIEYDRALHPNSPKEDYAWIDCEEAYDNRKMWMLLRKYDKMGALIAASISNNGELKRDDGIVAGHAYTIKQIYSFKKYKLLNLRNPWGQWEWNGKWSDNDKKTWNQHKKLAKKINFVAKNDGSFWMEYKDFLNTFNVVEICDRTTISNLHLNINEDDHETPYKLAICKGCITGCYQYWCCCRGMKNVYFGRRASSKQTVDTKNKCLSTFCPHIDQKDGKQWKE